MPSFGALPSTAQNVFRLPSIASAPRWLGSVLDAVAAVGCTIEYLGLSFFCRDFRSFDTHVCTGFLTGPILGMVASATAATRISSPILLAAFPAFTFPLLPPRPGRSPALTTFGLRAGKIFRHHGTLAVATTASTGGFGLGDGRGGFGLGLGLAGRLLLGLLAGAGLLLGAASRFLVGLALSFGLGLGLLLGLCHCLFFHASGGVLLGRHPSGFLF